MKRAKIRYVLSSIAVLGLLLTACGKDENNGAETPAPTPDYEQIPVSEGIALRIGGVDISREEYRYCFNLAYHNFVEYNVNSIYEYSGLDPDQPLDDQICYDDVTWGDYFRDETIDTLRRTVILSQEALKAGQTLAERASDEIRSYIDELNAYCDSAGITIRQYLRDTYGGSVVTDTIYDALSRMRLADQYEMFYRSSVRVPESDIDSAYAASPKSFDKVDCRIYSFMYATQEERVIQLSRAEEMRSAVTGGGSFIELAASYAELEAIEDFDADLYTLFEDMYYQEDVVMDWLFDTKRAAGDCEVIEESGAFAVVYFLERSRSEEESVNLRCIYFESEAKAGEILELWKNGGATETEFARLAMEYSEDSGTASDGGLYLAIPEGLMEEEFDAWCFEPTRKYGDTGIVKTEDGVNVLFFIDKMPYWKQLVRDSLTDKIYQEYYDGLYKQYTLDIVDINISPEVADS